MRYTLSSPLVLLLVACGSGQMLPPDMPPPMDPPPDTSKHDVDLTTLPCDVAVVLQRNCTSCHGSPPTQNAPMSLLSRSDLTAIWAGDSNYTVADRSLLRMQATLNMMPPSGQASAADIQTFKTWVEAGSLPGSCTSNPPPAPTTCDSGKHWQYGDNYGVSMNPGEACQTCHAANRVNEIFTAAGTVYSDLHADTLCMGAGTTGTIDIIGSDGAVTTLSANSSGNFATFAGIARPYTARLTRNGKTRAMSTPQTSGDCNSCHTVQGAQGAPGRIIWP